MTAPTRASRRPHPLLTVLAMAVVLIGLGYALQGVGFCLAWAGDTVFGARP